MAPTVLMEKRVWDQPVPRGIGTSLSCAQNSLTLEVSCTTSTTCFPADKQPPVYNKLESLLRAAVKQCLPDPQFARRFENDYRVLEEYPWPRGLARNDWFQGVALRSARNDERASFPCKFPHWSFHKVSVNVACRCERGGRIILSELHCVNN